MFPPTGDLNESLHEILQATAATGRKQQMKGLENNRTALYLVFTSASSSKNGTGHDLVCKPNFEPFGAFPPKINKFGT